MRLSALNAWQRPYHLKKIADVFYNKNVMVYFVLLSVKYSMKKLQIFLGT